ncbi:hypothetical protein ACIG56_12655 [Nocardia fusca]|uniref:hypothetical protein n=1 Tax=Nocardia fusca TaxID=941183 RepID=UPI0037CA1D49
MEPDLPPGQCLAAVGDDHLPQLLGPTLVQRLGGDLLKWGDDHRADPEGPSLTVVHRDCGAPVDVVVRCRDGHDLDGPREAETHAGPAARRLAGRRPAS